MVCGFNGKGRIRAVELATDDLRERFSWVDAVSRSAFRQAVDSPLRDLQAVVESRHHRHVLLHFGRHLVAQPVQEQPELAKRFAVVDQVEKPGGAANRLRFEPVDGASEEAVPMGDGVVVALVNSLWLQSAKRLDWHPVTKRFRSTDERATSFRNSPSIHLQQCFGRKLFERIATFAPQ